MKKALSLLALVATINASAFNMGDFDALSETALANATDAAVEYAQVLGVEVETVEAREMGPLSLVSKFDVTTNTACTMVVNVGFAFRAKVVEAYNCK